MSDDTFTAEVEPKKSGGSGCLKGCLIFVGVVIVLAVLAGWWVSRSWRGWMGAGVTQTVDAMLETSDLPAAEKQEIKAEAQRVADGIADGSISVEQMQQIMVGLAESPLLPMMLVKSVEAQYLDSSGLSDEEKAEGRVALERYASGLADGKFGQESNDKLMVHIADQDSNGQWQIRKTVSDDDLRAFLATAKEEADAAGIPEEVAPIDPSEELKKVIDKVLGGAAPAAPPAAA